MTDYTRRDEWLKRADGVDGLRAARLMTEAECLVDARESTRALAVVAQLHAAGARHIQSLRVALKANQYAGQWEEVLRLLRTLNKRDAIHPAAARQIKILAYRELLEARGSDGYGLIAFWQDVPQSDRRLPEIAQAAARAFNAAGLGYQARVVLETALGLEWNADLVAEYGTCAEENSTAQIDRAERWLVNHPNDAHLQFALGILCSRQHLWGKAQAYLTEALESSPDAALRGRIHLALAQLLEEIGQNTEAATHFRLAALAQYRDEKLLVG
jgi:HemY protein